MWTNWRDGVGRWWRQPGWRLVVAAAMVLSGCQSAVPVVSPMPGAYPASGSLGLFAGWEEKHLPGKRWQPFVPVEIDGARGLQVESGASLSLLRTKFHPHRTPSGELQFSWWVHDVLPEADLSDSQASDAPVQLALAFDGDRTQLSGRFAVMSELTQLFTGDPLPYATLIYAWASGTDHPVGTVIRDPRTDRIRYLVVEQGTDRLRRWVHHRRQIQADFVQAFGEQPGPLMGMAIMSDSDNTGGSTRAVFGPVTWLP